MNGAFVLEGLDKLRDVCSFMEFVEKTLIQHEECFKKFQVLKKNLSKALLKISAKIYSEDNKIKYCYENDAKFISDNDDKIIELEKIFYQEDVVNLQASFLIEDIKNIAFFIQKILTKDYSILSDMNQNEINLIREKNLIIISEGFY